jgi:flagellar biosynthesis protein FlhB
MSQGNGSLKPTAARVREFRARGDIARSRDTVAAAALAGALLGLLLTASGSWAALCSLVEQACLHPTVEALAPLARRALWVGLSVAAPALLGACAGALLAIALQLGWPPALWSRRRAERAGTAASFASLRQALGPPAMARRTVITIAKLVAIIGSMALALSPRDVLRVAEAPQLLDGLAACCTTALVTSSLVILALGLVDYAWARRRLFARMRMTHDDMRRELRELEGDPAIKSRRQRRRNELARQRFTAVTAQAIASATVVVLAPGEAAVALRYRGRAGEATPQLAAKGRGVLAEHLAQLARDRGVPVLVRVELATALAALAERQPIPPELYRAVAEVLATTLAHPAAPPALPAAEAS